MAELPRLYFKDRTEWRHWLKSNHSSSEGIWMVYYKKHTKIMSIPYAEAVEEALCFGWIDSLVKRIDEERYMQKYTPRKPKSTWSKINKERALKLIQEKKMTPAGMKLIEEAKKSGWWEKAYATTKKEVKIPEDLLTALKSNEMALTNFMNFTLSQRNQYIFWIEMAKRKETRDQRIMKTVERSEKNIKPGIA